MAGRLCLIKFVLSAIPLYYLSLFKLRRWFVRVLSVSRGDFCGDGVRRTGMSLG